MAHTINIFGYSDDLIYVDNLSWDGDGRAPLDEEYTADWEEARGVLCLVDKATNEWCHVEVAYGLRTDGIWRVKVLEEGRGSDLPCWALKAEYIHGELDPEGDYTEILEMVVPENTFIKQVYPKPDEWD